MNPVYRQPQLYTFLYYCNDNNLEKTILDCGAGGNCPPLGIFHAHGYKTTGIDISDHAIEASKSFQSLYNMDLGIIKGNMATLNFEDKAFSFVYTYNSIFHLKKVDIKQSLNEMKRVMNDKGYMFFNLLAIEDMAFNDGTKVGDGEFLQKENGGEVIHSYYTEDECLELIESLGLKIIYREKRERFMTFDELVGPLAYYDFIVAKK